MPHDAQQEPKHVVIAGVAAQEFPDIAGEVLACEALNGGVVGHRAPNPASRELLARLVQDASPRGRGQLAGVAALKEHFGSDLLNAY